MTFDLNGTTVTCNKDDFLLVMRLWSAPALEWALRAKCELQDTIFLCNTKSLLQRVFTLMSLKRFA